MKKNTSKPKKRPSTNPITAMIIQQNPQYIKQENYLKSLYNVMLIRASEFVTMKMVIIHNTHTLQPNLKITIIGGLIRDEGEQSLLKDLATMTIEPGTTLTDIGQWFHENTDYHL